MLHCHHYDLAVSTQSHVPPLLGWMRQTFVVKTLLNGMFTKNSLYWITWVMGHAVGCVPGRSDWFTVFVPHTHQIPAVVSTQVVDEVSLSYPLGMSKLLVVEVEVHPVVVHVVHCTCHRHLYTWLCSRFIRPEEKPEPSTSASRTNPKCLQPHNSLNTINRSTES